MSYCFRHISIVTSFISIPNALATIIKIAQSAKDEEIIINALRIIKGCLRSDRDYALVLHQEAKLFDILIKFLVPEIYSEGIIEEAIGALRYYTRRTEGLEMIENPKALEPLCKSIIGNSSAKYNNSVISTLHNCCKRQELLSYIKSTRAYEAVVIHNV